MFKHATLLCLLFCPAFTLAQDNTTAAIERAVAELAKKKKISEVVFNRNGFLFHGRVKALADAAREAGLQF